MSTSDKPLRADARRNRARLLEVAETVFAELGTAAPTEEVARQAGVGIGTLFRHFPTKEALLEAVFLARLRRLVDEAVALTNSSDPGAGFFAFFTRVVEESATKITYIDALSAAGVDLRNTLVDVRAELRAALGDLLSAAQRAGAVRADVGVPEVLALLVGAAQSARSVRVESAAAGRVLEVVLDGLRPSAGTVGPTS